ncbi:protein kinase domain containing protein [Stylonychia lemnae]|uniref:Protein kinase domain containing protein n=1 Tax=Stylonychia lemnae TaxID=5949 RepID=A0A078AQC9_STYLE|nr:protein kinase domain containing protein [Stylonychia lemnae]|eukprot:CDW84156.1 protein kinase domain containing protein [Stylonychia lemnae]
MTTYLNSQHATNIQGQVIQKRQSHGQAITKFKPNYSSQQSTSPSTNQRYTKPSKQNFNIASNNQVKVGKIYLEENQLNLHRLGAQSNSPKGHSKASLNQQKMFVVHKNQDYPSVSDNNTFDAQNVQMKAGGVSNYIMLSQELKKAPQRVSQEQSKLKLNKSNQSQGSYKNKINTTHQDYLLQQNKSPSNMQYEKGSKIQRRDSAKLENGHQSFGSMSRQINNYYQIIQNNQQAIMQHQMVTRTRNHDDEKIHKFNTTQQIGKRDSIKDQSSLALSNIPQQILSPNNPTKNQNIFNQKRQSYQPQLTKQTYAYNKNQDPIILSPKNKNKLDRQFFSDEEENVNNCSKDSSQNAQNWQRLSKDSQDNGYNPQNDIKDNYYSKNVKIQSQIKDIARQLWVAAEVGDQQVILKILKSLSQSQSQLQINCTNSDGWTPLHVAASEGHTHIVDILIQQGANIECKTKSNRTPLHIACIRGNLGVVQILVLAGSDTNAKDVDGNTPAHFCAEYGHHDSLRFLLTKHPTLFAKNKEGKSPIDLSVSNEILMTFEEYIQSAKHFLYAKETQQQIQVQNNTEAQSTSLGSQRQRPQQQLNTNSSGSEQSKTSRYSIDEHKQQNNQTKQIQILDSKMRTTQNSNGERQQQPNDLPNQNPYMSATQPQKIQDFNKASYSSGSTQGMQQTPSSYSLKQLPVEEKEDIRLGPDMFVPLKMLGSGSFGEVYLVKEKGTNQLYAMKVLNKSKIMGQNLVRYAKTERNVLSYTKHPFIVNLNYAFQTDTKLFLILDFCPGGDLGKCLQRERKFTEDRARIYAAEILLALEDLHKRDIIYRDLKPDNVVLDFDGHAQLTDFGLSKEGVEEVAKGAKSFCGSVAYLAPEMLRRAGHGKSVDWYLFGVLLYEMVVGCPPYFSPKKEELFNNIQKGVLKIPASLSEECKNLIVSLLNRNPAKRLGAGSDGSQEIKEHPFFEPMDWNVAKAKQLKPPKPDINMKLLQQIQNFDQPPDESLYRVFEDTEELDPDIFENKTVEGWSFIQGIGTIIHQD